MYFSVATHPYLILVMTIKLSFLFFYHHILFSTHTKSKYLIISAMIFVGLLNTSLFITALLSCISIEREWSPAVPSRCFNPVIFPYFSGISTFLTDLYVLILPISLLWQMNMRLQQKLKLSAVFGLGIELRISYDATWITSNIIVWAALEANIGIICSCLIVLPAFLDYYLPWSTRFFSSLFSSTSSGKPLNNPDYLSKPSADSWYRPHLLVEGQRPLQNSIIQTNTFSLGEIHDHSNSRPGNILPWASHTN
ncbi:hypothetical protein GGR58DRAFT_18006 [Xylaria digitata]|nr:hypothetical protein GGR58DRAFT_18006 [Xylaria digitata]